MPGSAQPYVRSKRREKWRQRHPFGDIDTTLPTAYRAQGAQYTLTNTACQSEAVGAKRQPRSSRLEMGVCVF